MSSPPASVTPNVVVSSPVSPTFSTKVNKHQLGAPPNRDSDEEKEQRESAIPLEDMQNGHLINNEEAVDAVDMQPRLVSSGPDRKGKGRATAAVEDEPMERDVADEMGNYELHEAPEQVGFAEDDYEEDVNASYPPVGDDELEERRVSETLKRWEEQERQRRRALRDSNRTSMSRTSLVDDVSRRASKLWNESAQRRSSLRRGATRIRDRDHSFEDASSRRTSEGATSSSLAPATPTRQDTGRSASPSSPTPLVANNPFNTPRMGSPTSLLEERPASAYGYPKSPNERDVFMEEVSNPPTPTPEAHERDPEYPDRPILQASNSYSLDTLSKPAPAASSSRGKRDSAPPPKPLDLPEEVTAQGMRRTPSPMVVERSDAELADDDEIEAREKTEGRWWTDWLCGCRENRTTEQAGRTNPFE